MNTLSSNRRPVPLPGAICCNPFDQTDFMSGRQVYYSMYNRLPSLLVVGGINPDAVHQWVQARAEAGTAGLFRHEIRDSSTGRLSLQSLISIEYDHELILQVDAGEVLIIYGSEREAYARELYHILAAFVDKPKRSTLCVYVVTDGAAGPDLQRLACPARRAQLKTHYNDDLLRLHPQLLRTLRSKGRSGLYLLHGQPGTGKSSYIRSLLPQLSKRCIFLSPRLAGSLDSPGLAGILLRNPESILIIEDAEELLASRDPSGSAGIANLLNVTDGVLGASLGIQVICTFNTRLTSIDPALLRRGRLIARYEFGPLCSSKAQALLAGTMPGFRTAEPMTLAEIFNRPITPPDPAPLPIGFRRMPQEP